MHKKDNKADTTLSTGRQKIVITAAIFFLTCICAGVSSCAKLPQNVVDPAKYLGSSASADSTEAKEPLRVSYEDLFRSYQKVPPLRALFIADIKDDDVYGSIEVQYFEDETGENAYRLILYRKAAGRNEGAMDNLYSAGDTFIESWRTGETIPNASSHFVPLDVAWNFSETMLITARFKDPTGRSWDVSLRDRRETIPPSAMLAPIAERVTSPESFPFIFMNDITLIPKKSLDYSIFIDGKKVTFGNFPVLMNGQPCYFARYTKDVVMLDLFASGSRAGSIPVACTLRQDAENRLCGAAWRPVKGDEIIMQFSPALPDPEEVALNTTFRSKWIIGTQNKTAVIAGTASLQNIGGRLSLSLTIDKGWSPYPGTPWMKDFSMVAEYSPETHTWIKKWSRGSSTSEKK